MQFYLLGLLVSAIGTLPLWFAKKFITAVVMIIVGSLVLGTSFYLIVPLTVWPWWGLYGVSAAVMLLISAIVACINYDNWDENPSLRPSSYLVGLLLIAMILSPMSGCALFRSGEYAALIGDVEARTWTDDIQPKHPGHIRMASVENAVFSAKQAFGQAGTIGSQFQVKESSVTPQFIGGKYKIIVPLDFRGFFEWNATGTIPGYMEVNGEDPTASAVFVKLPPGKEFKYSPNACFQYNLERHIWYQGYYNYAIASYALEVDDNGKPWWTVALYKPACFAWGKQFSGLLLVDPVSGECTMYEPGQIPQWVDLAVPPELVNQWVDYKGTYSGGWLNTVFSKKDLTLGESPVMVYGSDSEPYWVTGVTSHNPKDTSIVGLYYTNTRTGKSVFYKAEGSTDKAILNAVATNQEVQFKKLHGTVPQIYNIRGTMASIVPLLNEGHQFQGVAIVNVKNVQLMGIGKDQHEALRQYERVLPLVGHQIAPDLSKKLEKKKGVVERIVLVPQGNAPLFYVYLKGVPHIFTGGVQLSDKLPLTMAGDEVKIEYYASGQSIEPLHAFDNLAIKLESTPQEKEVKAAAEIMRKENERRFSAFDLDKLSDAQLQQLMEDLQKRNKKSGK